MVCWDVMNDETWRVGVGTCRKRGGVGSPHGGERGGAGKEGWGWVKGCGWEVLEVCMRGCVRVHECVLELGGVTRDG